MTSKGLCYIQNQGHLNVWRVKKKNTENKHSKVIRAKNGRILLLSKGSVCNRN